MDSGSYQLAEAVAAGQRGAGEGEGRMGRQRQHDSYNNLRPATTTTYKQRKLQQSQTGRKAGKSRGEKQLKQRNNYRKQNLKQKELTKPKTKPHAKGGWHPKARRRNREGLSLGLGWHEHERR